MYGSSEVTCSANTASAAFASSGASETTTASEREKETARLRALAAAAEIESKQNVEEQLAAQRLLQISETAQIAEKRRSEVQRHQLEQIQTTQERPGREESPMEQREGHEGRPISGEDRGQDDNAREKTADGAFALDKTARPQKGIEEAAQRKREEEEAKPLQIGTLITVLSKSKKWRQARIAVGQRLHARTNAQERARTHTHTHTQNVPLHVNTDAECTHSRSTVGKYSCIMRGST